MVDVTFRASAVHQVEAVSTRLFHHAEQPLAITLDGEVIDAPGTNAVLAQNVEITGGEMQPFTRSTADQLAGVLDAGALPLAFTFGAR